MRRVYDRSDALRTIPLRPGAGLLETVGRLRSALESGDQRQVASCPANCRRDLCEPRVPDCGSSCKGGVRLQLRASSTVSIRPGNTDRRDTVKLWMITAKRGQVVAFRTFLRTLLHEICHHLDYTLLDLSESYHTGDSTSARAVWSAAWSMVRAPAVVGCPSRKGRAHGTSRPHGADRTAEVRQRT